jgi:cyclopropane fatty-acyl-phospholipid synthase-like methyltransferase
MTLACTACRNCGGTNWRVKYRFSSVAKTIKQCGVCRLMVLDPLPTEADLKSVYNETYFANDQLVRYDVSKIYGYVDYISERINKQRGYQRICTKLKQYVRTTSPKPTLLDFGCGLGFFLDAAFDYGFALQGIEFNRWALDYVRSRYAYPVAGFEMLTQLKQRFDVVVLFDVIEHLLDPFEFVAQLREAVADDGVIAVSTMDSLSLVSRMMGPRLEDFRRIREHVYFFSRSNLTDLLRRHGFEILEVSSLGHSFQVEQLVARITSALPSVGAPLSLLLKLFPFARGHSVYLNPRTKFIVYARKRPAAA